jgi:hypothetical protein
LRKLLSAFALADRVIDERGTRDGATEDIAEAAIEAARSEIIAAVEALPHAPIARHQGAMVVIDRGALLALLRREDGAPT